MNNLKEALEVLRILERNNFESYLVGGVVRDYILKQPINDIDITTLAKPNEVLNHFRGIPTGIKYGTITIEYKRKKYEVTTFRSEESYNDFRRPEKVVFETDVKEDVLRRDFTINGLLMNQAAEIIDYVEGREDLKNKLIRTIGNPVDRFNEDALRMLRAFYFESKLGFNIEPNTLEGIKQNKELLKNVSSERVLMEINKMLEHPHLIKALNSMIKSNVHEVLPGLKEGILVLSKQQETVRPVIFFALSFHLNKNILPSYWKFSNKFRHQIRQVMELVNKGTDYTMLELFDYGLNNCLDANYINYLLGRDVIKEKELKRLYKELPIESSLDLKFRAKDILEITNKKAGAWVNNLVNDLTKKVITNELTNEYEALKAYVLKNYENF